MKKEMLGVLLFEDASELIKALNDLIMDAPGRSVLYVYDAEGNPLRCVGLEAETLSDGSIAYNIRFAEDALDLEH